MSFGKRWAERYQQAWENDDADAAAALNAPGCIFRSAPFREPEPPRSFTTRVFPEAGAEAVRFGGATTGTSSPGAAIRLQGGAASAAARGRRAS
jgi:hypothetical protein